MSFNIISGKESASPKRPLFLVTITAPDGDVCYLTTAAYYGAPNLAYNGNTYLARIQKNDLQAIQACGPQGYDSVPGFSMTLADADKSLWTNHCIPHGWRGSVVVLTVILWDVVANTYSTDSYQWTFIGGNPQHNYAQGQTTLDVTSSTNFTRLKVPSIPIEYRCPWDFPSTSAQRAAGLNDPTSPYYQCGYSADQSGGVGNYASGSTCFTTCDLTRSSPTDPSVGCMARMGNASNLVAPDGDLSHDIAGHSTARFGGVTWLAPAQYSGRQYVSGQKTFGFNSANSAIAGSYYNFVYGTQWVPCSVLAPAGDPNSLRSECVVCVSAFGPANVMQLLVNGVTVPQYGYGSDVLFTWRYINQGGRSGALNMDSIFNGAGDPHGSVCCIEFVVPAELAAPGSTPTVMALVTSGPILNVYAIASITAGVVTLTGPNWSCAGNAPFYVIIVGNSNPALNGTWGLYSWAGGLPGTITLLGTTASGTGGGVFFYCRPDLLDTGGDILSNPTGNYVNVAGPAANLAFAVLDLMTWGNITLAQIDPISWYNAAQICAQQLSYVAPDGSTQTHAQFKASFALLGTSRQSLAQVLTAARNSGNLMIAPNSTTGLIQCFVKQTLADQQPAPVSGSNYNTAVASVTAAGAVANGYFAYVFDETVIEKDSFKVTTTRIEATPNTVSFPFQDEQNGYTQDSLTEIDPNSYAYSGNQEISVPVPVNAIPNFDQATRVANTQLAEALFGNPRNDAGGTLYFEFSVNQRVLHLASRLGYICGLTWQALSIGVGAPQAVRVMSLKPDTDGEHWQVKCAWHNDEWYTYAYGQNPTPFQTNPLLSPPARPPYPWRPGVAVWGSTDALWPNRMGFALGLDPSAYPAQITISGTEPVNVQATTKPPLVPLQSATANTGGTIPPGTYMVAFSPNGVDGPVSGFTTVVVPTGTSTNTITVAGIQWQSGAAPAIQPYIGTSSLNMRAAASASYTGSSPDSNGNPTVYTFTATTPDGLGLPDVNAAAIQVSEYAISNPGIWLDTISAVDGTGKILTLQNGGAWTAHGWTGRVLSLYYRPGVTPQPGLNMAVSDNAAGTLTMPSIGFLAGDIVTLRFHVSSANSNSVTDSGVTAFAYGAPGKVTRFIQSRTGRGGSGAGWTVNSLVGNWVLIIGGTGAGSSPKTVASNTASKVTITGTFDVTPDSTSIFIIVAPTVVYQSPSKAFTNDGSQTPSSIVSVAAQGQAQSQLLLISAAIVDTGDNGFPVQYQPFREVYVPDQTAVLTCQVARQVTATGAMLATDGVVTFV